MLDHLRNECRMSSPYLPQDSLEQVEEASIHPELPEHTNARAEGCSVRFDHAESAVNGPEDKENCEQMMGVPESLKIRASSFLEGCEKHGHEGEEHDISGPARASLEICKQPSLKAELILYCELREVVPVSKGVEPGKEDDGIRHDWCMLVNTFARSSGVTNVCGK